MLIEFQITKIKSENFTEFQLIVCHYNVMRGDLGAVHKIRLYFKGRGGRQIRTGSDEGEGV